MATVYKPSKWRGKRVEYQSIDPAEPKRETTRIGVLLVVFALFMAIVIGSAYR